MTESGEQVSDALRGNEGLTPSMAMPTPFPQQEVGGQYPTKPFTPPTAGPEGETAQTATSTAPTPMELASQQGLPQGQVTQEQLKTQTTQLQQQSATLSGQLQEQYPTLSDGQKSLLNVKLNKYQGQTAKAAQLLGTPPASNQEKKAALDEAKKQGGDNSGLTHLLSMITGGDTTLRGITKQLSESPEGSINPVVMLRAQGALASASQAVNFATAVIGQGLQFLKTIMQTQI